MDIILLISNVSLHLSRKSEFVARRKNKSSKYAGTKITKFLEVESFKSLEA